MGTSRDLEEMPVVLRSTSLGPPVGMTGARDDDSSSESAARIL